MGAMDVTADSHLETWPNVLFAVGAHEDVALAEGAWRGAPLVLVLLSVRSLDFVLVVDVVALGVWTLLFQNHDDLVGRARFLLLG